MRIEETDVRPHTILHTIETGGPGGAETVVFNLATQLDRKAFRSIALLPKGPWLNPKLRESGVPLYEVDWHAWYDLRGPLEMARIIRREKVDLIHSHLPGQNFYSCLAGVLTGRKTLVTYHGPVELSDAKSMKGAFRLWFVRKTAAGVIVVCNLMGEKLKEIGFSSRDIVRIYNGIDTARFEGRNDQHLRKALGFGDATKLVGMIANVRQSKGYDNFVRAARKVLDQWPDVRFLAVGDVDPVIAEPVFRLVKELALEDKFVFLGFREDIAEILGELDIFVLASSSEGFPLATLEAMAAGKAMVVTRCGGPQEVVDHGRTGFLVPPADPDSLATKICELLSNESQARAFGDNARAKVNREFTLDAMINHYEHLYKRFLES